MLVIPHINIKKNNTVMKKHLHKTIVEFIKETAYNNIIIAYHGTDNKFSVFDDSKPIFFVDNIVHLKGHYQD